MFSTIGDFLQVEKRRILRSNAFASNYVSIWEKNFYGDSSDVATGLWRELFEPYAMSRVVAAFQIVNVPTINFRSVNTVEFVYNVIKVAEYFVSL